MRFAPSSRYRITSFLMITLCAAIAGAQGHLKTITATPLITQEIDDSRLVPLKGNIHPLATAAADMGKAADSLQLPRNILLLKRSAAQDSALKKLLEDQQNPKSPNYHNWLTPAQYGKQFGAAPEDIQKITAWLTNHGFTVDPPMAGRNLIMFSGTHAELEDAFHTELHTYEVKGKRYYANSTNPLIPAALAPVVSGFSSLNNFPKHALHTPPRAIRRDKSTWKFVTQASNAQPNFTVQNPNESLHVIGPSDLATMYNVQPLWDAGIDGTGQTIAIVSDSDINPADIDYFRKTFGLPAKHLNVLYFGPSPGLTQDESEADLDVEWAGAVAKGATIDLVVAADTATSGGIDGAAAYIINNNLASILNVSYGECEQFLGPAGNQYYTESWEQAAAQGITVLAAAGDWGSAVCDAGDENLNRPGETYSEYGMTVNGIASTAYDVAVGGTDLYSEYADPDKYWNSTNAPTTLQSVKSYIPEIPWNDSCASPELQSTLQSLGDPDQTTESLCNDSAAQSSYLNVIGGSGGASNCVTTINGSSTCANGYPKPAWQAGPSGIPSDGVRDLPDVSFMAGDGLWGSFYAFYQSDAVFLNTFDPTNTDLEGAGGTSFASPIFAGMIALVQQKTADNLGNPNYVLYKLAASQAGNGNCTSDNVASGNGCIFYDITDGSNAVPCLAGTKSCTPSNSADEFGILPGYSAGSGYDLATGLGSVNAYNLVEGWSGTSTTFLPTATTLVANGSTTAAYGAVLNVDVAVSAVGAFHWHT